MKLFTKQEQTYRLREQTFGCQREGWGRVGIVKKLGWTDTHSYI